MATITRFEDLEVWKMGRALVKHVYEISGAGAWAKDFGLRDQMRRASVSVCSNIAEGFERDGRREFIQFLSQAKGSCGEVRSQLHHALDAGYLDSSAFELLHTDCTVISAKLSRFIEYLRTSSVPGSKFRPAGET